MLQKVLAKFEHPNYFDNPTKLFSDLIKFVNISIKLFFPCIGLAKERKKILASQMQQNKYFFYFISIYFSLDAFSRQIRLQS